MASRVKKKKNSKINPNYLRKFSVVCEQLEPELPPLQSPAPSFSAATLDRRPVSKWAPVETGGLRKATGLNMPSVRYLPEFLRRIVGLRLILLDVHFPSIKFLILHRHFSLELSHCD